MQSTWFCFSSVLLEMVVFLPGVVVTGLGHGIGRVGSLGGTGVNFILCLTYPPVLTY